jgi:hypothetical protein
MTSEEDYSANEDFSNQESAHESSHDGVSEEGENEEQDSDHDGDGNEDDDHDSGVEADPDPEDDPHGTMHHTFRKGQGKACLEDFIDDVPKKKLKNLRSRKKGKEYTIFEDGHFYMIVCLV